MKPTDLPMYPKTVHLQNTSQIISGVLKDIPELFQVFDIKRGKWGT